jgi:hypothetical protein
MRVPPDGGLAMLVNRVNPIPNIANNLWNYIVTATCHFATGYWCFEDEFTRPPTLADVSKLLLPRLAVLDMLPYGAPLARPANGPLALTPGSVIVFVLDGAAKHSCVATAANTIGGYNQNGWFSGPGIDFGFTTHNTNELRWRGGGRNEVRGKNDEMWCQLIAVPERAAKGAVRMAIQPLKLPKSFAAGAPAASH